MRLISLLALLAITASATVAQPGLGATSFENSGADAAQEPFVRGLLLLHSFEYDDAREAFQQARAADPGFAMAAWGEAMTHNHPVWQRQNRDAALSALDGVTAMGGSPRETRYLMTLGVLFGEGEKDDRDDAYADAMRQLAEDYPNDLDAQAFYALSILGTAHEGRDFATYMRAAAVLEDVFARNPEHPGAAHYLIHAYDDPVHAPLGLRPARVYAEIAPGASHALHMPSHIYLALGLWSDVAEMNRRSFEAAKAGTDRRGAALNGHGWHALWWWHYAATQLENGPMADSLQTLAADLAQQSPDDPTAQAHLVRIVAQQSIAFGASTALDLATLPAESLSATSRAIRDHVRGMIALQEGRNDDARALADALLADAASDDASWSVRSAAHQLDGWVRVSTLDTAAGLDAMRRAAQIERDAPLTFGPPSPVMMSNEALGFALLLTEMPTGREDVIEAFEAALDRAPNRTETVRQLAALRGGTAEAR